MKKHLLVIDDDKYINDGLREYFESQGWEVTKAEDGLEAWNILTNDSATYTAVILDMKMPVMNGHDLLRKISEGKLQVPPIFVISAYLSEDGIASFKNIKKLYWLPKPMNPEDLAKPLQCIVEKNMKQLDAEIVKILLKHGKSEHQDRESRYSDDSSTFEEWCSQIDSDVKKRESVLVREFKKEVARRGNVYSTDEPVLVVGRRWNSWYPSFFKVSGGAYAVVSPEAEDGSIPSAVIDPGFQSFAILKELGIPVCDLGACAITHNHPDHMADIFELMCLRHVLGKDTSIYCNPSTAEMLKAYTGPKFQVMELGKNPRDFVGTYRYGNAPVWQNISIRGIDTDHMSIGGSDDTRGIVLEMRKGPGKDCAGNCSKAIILGDTHYEQAEQYKHFLDELSDRDVKVVVLHIGSSQMKINNGKHLYIPGMVNLLTDLDSRLKWNKYKGNLLVLVSEWGLEHATAKQIESALGREVPEFTDDSPISGIINLMQRYLWKIKLLPADIGLRVGMESGNIYLESDPGTAVPASEVRFSVNDSGLTYHR